MERLEVAMEWLEVAMMERLEVATEWLEVAMQ